MYEPFRLARPRRAVLAAAFCAMAFLPATTPAGELFTNATVGLKIGDDARFFLNLTNDHYAVPDRTAVTVLNRCARPQDDYPVVMLLARASGRSADAILSLRLHGVPWIDIFARTQVSPDVLFVGMERDPGPPYGHAWGYWKKQGGRGDARAALSDAQIVDLAKLQIVSGYYHVSPYTVVAERRRGSTIERYAVVRGRPAGAVDADRKQGGKGHGGHHGHEGQGQNEQGHGPHGGQNQR